ncbi:MAG: PAS domain S-box protein, partial [Proteobacteria bacterium]|nr:PAS domain S-box protein [Pseudomonadota bacterium]
MFEHDDVELSFRDLIETAPDGVLVCDHRVIRLVNAEAQRMFGYAREELVGQPIELLIPESVRGRHVTHVAGYTQKPTLRPMGIGRELVGRRKDGTELPIEISLSPTQRAGGILVTAVVRDVSQRRALERDNRRANAYLISAVDSVQDA